MSSSIDNIDSFREEYYPFKENKSKAKQLKREFPCLRIKINRWKVQIEFTSKWNDGQTSREILDRIKELAFIEN